MEDIYDEQIEDQLSNRDPAIERLSSAEEIESHITLFIDDIKEPDCILGKRINKKTRMVEYKVKWKGYPVENSEWMRYDSFVSKKLVIEFERNLEKSRKADMRLNRNYHHIGRKNLELFLNTAEKYGPVKKNKFIEKHKKRVFINLT